MSIPIKPSTSPTHFIVLLAAVVVLTARPTAVVADQPSATAKDSTASAEIRTFVDQLDKLTDDEIQDQADRLASQLLSELEFGPSLEQSKNRRSAWQRLRNSLLGDLTDSQKELEELKRWLRDQREVLREKFEQQRSDHYKRRYLLLLSRQAGRVTGYEARIASLKSQIAQLDNRINREVAREQIVSDQLMVAGDMSRQRPLPELPAEIAAPLQNGWGTAAEKTSDRPGRDDVAVVRRLIEELNRDE